MISPSDSNASAFLAAVKAVSACTMASGASQSVARTALRRSSASLSDGGLVSHEQAAQVTVTLFADAAEPLLERGLGAHGQELLGFGLDTRAPAPSTITAALFLRARCWLSKRRNSFCGGQRGGYLILGHELADALLRVTGLEA